MKLFKGKGKKKSKRIRYNRYTFQAIILTFIALFAYKTASSGGISSIMKGSIFDHPVEVNGDLEVHFIDVGQGDSILLMCDGEAMLIDAGNNDRGDDIADYLEYQQIDKLDYVVATHPDADHIGGMDDVLERFDCGKVIMTDDENDTITYNEFVDIMDEKSIERHVPYTGESFLFGCTTVTVLGPAGHESDVNDNSIVLMVEHGEESFLFSGDAGEAEMQGILENNKELKAAVYKVAHHGSRTGADEEFLGSVSPEFAVISCGEDNSYGHPHAAVLNWLRQNNVKVFRTDEQGTIIAVSDGEGITWNVSPSESWQSGE